MKRKNIPVILMLTAGAVTSIVTFIMLDEFLERLVSLLIVLVVFYVLGSLLVWVLDYFDKQNEMAALEKGEVIEKEPEAGETEETIT